jgi:hypothetical protein
MPLAAVLMKTKIPRHSLIVLLAAGHAAVAAPSPAARQHCVHPAVILWGDGRHDDTKALQAWLRGADALWGESGAPVGATIAWHQFRLSAAIYVDAGSGRTLSNFRFIWPRRGETVTGGTIRAGTDPNAEPAMSDVHIVGGDAGEGKPIALPVVPPAHSGGASCGIS